MGTVASMLRSIGNAVAGIARWGFTTIDEEPPPQKPAHPGPPHGPVPAIELRRAARRKNGPPG